MLVHLQYHPGSLIPKASNATCRCEFAICREFPMAAKLQPPTRFQAWARPNWRRFETMIPGRWDQKHVGVSQSFTIHGSITLLLLPVKQSSQIGSIRRSNCNRHIDWCLFLWRHKSCIEESSNSGKTSISCDKCSNQFAVRGHAATRTSNRYPVPEINQEASKQVMARMEERVL